MKFLVLIEKHQNAIIGALIIHVLIFVWLNIQNISFYVIQPKEKVLATLDFRESKSTLEKPIEVIVKLNLFEKTVSPPLRYILYFFCSEFNALRIFNKFDLEKVFLSPEPEIK